MWFARFINSAQTNATYKEAYDRHGIRIVFKVTGSIGRFSMQQLLIQLVTSLGMFVVAKLTVDIWVGKHMGGSFRKNKTVCFIWFWIYQINKTV